MLSLPATAQIRNEGAIPDGRGGVGVLALGMNHTCGLRQDGTASCWGENWAGQATPPPGTFIELSAGFDHTCGLRGDGSVACWGDGYTARDGAPEPPPPPPMMSGTFTALASGMMHTCGIRARAEPWQYSEGNVACWTANSWGPSLQPPAGGDFVALSVGDDFACGLRADGRAECWGSIDAAMLPEGAFIAVSAGARHACGLRADGSVACWGDNYAGQATPPAELFTAISAGAFSTCGLRTDSSVQCWGENWGGQSTPPVDERFIAISAGAHHVCGVRLNGQVACWGQVNWNYQYGPPPQQLPQLRPFEGVFGVGQLAAGDWHHCQVNPEGRLACWGGFEPDPAPWARFSAVASGDNYSCGRNQEGRLECFGYNEGLQQGLPFEPLRQFDLGYEHGCAVLALDGRAQCWGRETNGKTLAPEGLFRNLSAGLMHSCGVAADGAGQCWGYDGDGQSTVPPLPPERRFLGIQAGERHSCGLDSDLHIKCWGMSPPLFNDPYTYPWDPQNHPDFATFRALSVGIHHSCAIRTNGRLLCWGADWDGQLQVPEGTFVAVSAGRNQSCAIRTDGTRACWGAPWLSPRLVLYPDHMLGVRPNQWLDVRFELRSEPPYQVQEPRYAIVAGTLPLGFILHADGSLHGSWHETGRFPITVEGRDRNGFAVRRDYVLAIDDTPPVIEPQVTGTTGENGWYTSPVEVQWSVTDPESEIRWSVGCDPAQVQNETIGAGFFCHAESAGGLAYRELHLKVDLFPPDVMLRAFEATGALARFEFDGHDPTSGITGFECSLDGAAFAPCSSPLQSTFAPGEHEMQIRAVDAAGHRSEPVSQRWFADATAPEVTATVSGPLGTNNWYVGNVQIQWNLRDDESPITSASGCGPATLVSDALQAYFYCTATSRGGTRMREVAVRRDTVAPDTRLISMPVFASNATSASFEFDGSDATSGVVGYECRIDNGAYAPCSSPKRYDNLGHGLHTFYARAIDAAGHRDATPREYDFVVDTTPPVITYNVYGTQGSNGWYTNDVLVYFAIQDNDSNYNNTPGCEMGSQRVDTAGRDFICSATSAGGTANKTVTIHRDATPPDTRFSATPAASGNATQATFAFEGDDATAGVASYECSLDGAAFASCASPLNVEVAPGTHTFAVRAVDHAGHRDPSPTNHGWTVDVTSPVVTPGVVGTLGNNGWYVGDVQISWEVADADSGVTTTGCNTVVLTSDTPGASFTCNATSAGGTTTRTVRVKRDATAPVITAAATTAPNTAGWYKDDVTVGFSCSDATSGGVACPAAQVLDGEGAAIASAARSLTDAAGNSAISNVVTVNIDRTAPTLAPTVSPGAVLLNGTASAAANGSDGRSGIASESCAALATGSIGNKTVVCTVTDRAGNTASAGASYRVVYAFVGFSSPVQNLPTLNVIKAGRSIPFRWRVVDAQGAPVTNLAAAGIGASSISCPSATENRIYSYGGSSGQLQNLGNGYYQLDWMAASSLRGYCRRLDLNLGDGQAYPAQFKFN